MTISNVFTAMSTVYQTVLTMFGNMVTTITGNPLLYVPVLIALLGGLVMFTLSIVRKLGIRGISSTGRRRISGRR